MSVSLLGIFCRGRQSDHQNRKAHFFANERWNGQSGYNYDTIFLWVCWVPNVTFECGHAVFSDYLKFWNAVDWVSIICVTADQSPWLVALFHWVYTPYLSRPESLRCLRRHWNLCTFDHRDRRDHRYNRYNIFLHCSGLRLFSAQVLMQTIDKFPLLKRPSFKPFGMGMLYHVIWCCFFPASPVTEWQLSCQVVLSLFAGPAEPHHFAKWGLGRLRRKLNALVGSVCCIVFNCVLLKFL